MEVIDKKIYDYISEGNLDIEKVMKDYTNYVYVIIKSIYANFTKEDIDEINLDVFLTLWKNQNKLDINNKMSAYIAGITKNLTKQKCRNLKVYDDIFDYEEEIISFMNVEFVYSKNEQQIIIINELKKLKKESIKIFVLYYYQNKSTKEISILNNLSESKVRTELFRIRKKLQKALKKGGYGFYE